MPAPLTTQPSRAPTRKVGAAAIAGAVVTLVAAALAQAGIQLSGDVAAALTTLVGLGVGWLVRERAPS